MIGYYIHHHGRGHLARARAVAGATTLPVVALSSLPAPAGTEPFADWIPLPRDDADSHDVESRDAGGALHWAPLGSVGYRSRMQVLAAWVQQYRPELMVVDVSVEVTTLLRLLGIPVVVVAGPGVRDDAPHTLAYRLATRIVAPWPEQVYRPTHLVPFAQKCVYVGAFSRFDHEPDDGTRSSAAGGPSVLVLFGAGGGGVSATELAAARDATPGWSWTAAGGEGTWSDDVWGLLQTADVVVTHGGLNALAEVAAARRPAVVIAQPRPFHEQEETAAALDRAGIAVSVPTWPQPAQWPALLEAARARGGDGWAGWSAGDGAARFAALLESLT